MSSQVQDRPVNDSGTLAIINALESVPMRRYVGCSYVCLALPDISGRLVTHSCVLSDSARFIASGWSHVLV